MIRLPFHSVVLTLKQLVLVPKLGMEPNPNGTFRPKAIWMHFHSIFPIFRDAKPLFFQLPERFPSPLPECFPSFPAKIVLR